MAYQPKTSFANDHNPFKLEVPKFTGEVPKPASNVLSFTSKVPIKNVPIPAIVKQRKGHTKYDEEFEKLLGLNSAIESTEEGFEVLRRALMRFVQFRGIQDQYSVRRQLNRETRMVTLWLEKK